MQTLQPNVLTPVNSSYVTTQAETQDSYPTNVPFSLFTGFDLVTAYRALIASYVRSERQPKETVPPA